MIHRDIKPANVMVTRGGEVKVMDFGIARIETQETAPQTSAVLGTASYLSPEQAQGLPVDARTDIYSLGTVLYELLTGRPPFTGDSPVAIAYKQVNETPVPPSEGELRRAAAPRRRGDARAVEEPRQPLPDGPRVPRGPGACEEGPGGAGHAADGRGRRGAHAGDLPPAGHAGARPPAGSAPGSGRKVWLGVLIGVLSWCACSGAAAICWRRACSATPTTERSRCPCPT